MTLRPLAEPRWIACRGEARSVIDGAVFCPRIDFVAWHRCLECRVLEAMDDDRERGCGEIGTSAPPVQSPATADHLVWPQLMIELL
jgi:hypothetical protein